MKQFKKHHPVILSKLSQGLRGDKRSKFKDPKKYVGTQYDFLGLSSPRQRELFEKGYGFESLSREEQLNIWNEVWRYSNSFEALSQALLFLEKYKKESERQQKESDPKVLWQVGQSWTSKIDNWAHSDVLSGIFAHVLEHFPKEVYGQFKKWNKSGNPWERRQSMVGLLEYSRKRRKVLSAGKLFAMVVPLLGDEDYYVQKGLGWTLREIGNVYPRETWEFLVKYSRVISSVAFSPAIEKLGEGKRQEIKLLRKRAKGQTAGRA